MFEDRGLRLVEGCEPRILCWRDGDVLAVDRTLKGGDDFGAGGGAVFLMSRVGDSDLGASMFYQNMLEAASSADERNALFSGDEHRCFGSAGLVIR